MSFGGFLGLGAHLYTVPWEKLHYDTGVGGYHTDVTEAELQDAPTLPHDSDQKREAEFRRYWKTPYYWE